MHERIYVIVPSERSDEWKEEVDRSLAMNNDRWDWYEIGENDLLTFHSGATNVATVSTIDWESMRERNAKRELWLSSESLPAENLKNLKKGIELLADGFVNASGVWTDSWDFQGENWSDSIDNWGNWLDDAISKLNPNDVLVVVDMHY